MSALTVRTHADAASFLDAALDTLQRNETANNLIVGVPLRLRAHPERLREQPYFATVHDAAGALAGAAMRTPPYHFVVHVEEGWADEQRGGEVLDALLRNVIETGTEVNGVNGRVPWSERFAARRQEATGVGHFLGTALRAFELRAVIPPPFAPGALRSATFDDLEVVGAYLRAFDAEALPNEPYNNRSDESIRLSVGDGNIFLWEVEGAPVSLVGRSRPLPHGITIAPVYTPPELRGRGYASNAVARLSQQLLDGGHDYCALFTDLANPISNSIYQKIGYRPVCDYADYNFETA